VLKKLLLQKHSAERKRTPDPREQQLEKSNGGNETAIAIPCVAAGNRTIGKALPEPVDSAIASVILTKYFGKTVKSKAKNDDI